MPKILHFMAQMEGYARLRPQLREQGAGEGAKIYISADGHARGGYRRGRVAAGHHQRYPVGNLDGVVAELQALKKGRVQEGGVALAQILHVGCAPHEAHVRNGVNEGRGVGQLAFMHQRGPELLAQLELLGDFISLADIDAAIGPFRRVIQFAEGRVAGAGIVPGIRAFGGYCVEALVQGDGQAGIQGFEQHAERGAHNTRADEHDIGNGFGGGGLVRWVHT